MNILCAADKTNRTHSVTMCVQRFVSSFYHFGIRGQSQIIVCTENNYFLHLTPGPSPRGEGRNSNFYNSALFGGDNALTLEESIIFNGLKFFLQVLFEGAVHRSIGY